jgi:hypothetical protein
VGGCDRPLAEQALVERLQRAGRLHAVAQRQEQAVVLAHILIGDGIQQGLAGTGRQRAAASSVWCKPVLGRAGLVGHQRQLGRCSQCAHQASVGCSQPRASGCNRFHPQSGHPSCMAGSVGGGRHARLGG